MSAGHDHDHDTTEIALRVEALESLLVEKGLVDPATVDEIVRHYEEDVGPHERRARRGARLGRSGVQGAPPRRRHRGRSPSWASAAARPRTWSVVENEPRVHNVVVCTLCSCYPWARARAAAGLVQVARVPLAHRARAARGARRDGARAAAGRRDARLGLERRGALPRAAGAAGAAPRRSRKRSWRSSSRATR